MRIKWICSKSKKNKINGKTNYNLTCENPCTPSPCGRIYHPSINKDYRLNCNIPRNSEKWSNLYKIKPVTERTNNIFSIKSLIA